jgi:hypothetical protein
MVTERESPKDVALFYGSRIGFSSISSWFSMHRFPICGNKADVTEIGRKRYRDVTRLSFSVRTLTMLCEERSYFD